MEIWKSVVGYEGLYEVSNNGRVKSLKFGKEKILKPGISNCGYTFFYLSYNGKSKFFTSHRLVGLAFISNTDSKNIINHINGIKSDNRVENLEWCTQSENIKHAYDTGLKKAINNHFQLNHPFKGIFGKNHFFAKKVNQYTLSGELMKEWGSIIDIERDLGIDGGNISKVCRGKKKTLGGFIWRYK